jgi:hypothetical protein
VNRLVSVRDRMIFLVIRFDCCDRGKPAPEFLE